LLHYAEVKLSLCVAGFLLCLRCKKQLASSSNANCLQEKRTAAAPHQFTAFCSVAQRLQCCSHAMHHHLFFSLHKTSNIQRESHLQHTEGITPPTTEGLSRFKIFPRQAKKFGPSFQMWFLLILFRSDCMEEWIC
jgi:hypothetical protein